MSFFSDNFFKWLGILASLFLISIGTLHIPNLDLTTKCIAAVILDLIFVLGLLVFIIIEYNDKHKNLANDYYVSYSYALSLEEKNKSLNEDLIETQQSLNEVVTYAQSIEEENTELNQKLTNLSNTLQKINTNRLQSPLYNIGSPIQYKKY